MKRYLLGILALVIFVVFSATVATADLMEGLVAYWPMDEGAGDVAADASGNGHDAALLAGAQWETAGPQVGSAAIEFDGTNGRLVAGTFDVVGGGITLAAWIKPDDFDIGDARVISKSTDWGGNDHWWMLSTINDNHVMRFRLKTDDGQSTETLIASSGELIAGEWVHVAASWDGSMMRLYRNGEEVGNIAKGGAAVATDASVAVSIGNQHPDTPHPDLPFDGLMDDLVVYSRALSSDELNELAAGGLASAAAVSATGKLTTTWGQLRQQ
jgi:hypothetical protein